MPEDAEDDVLEQIRSLEGYLANTTAALKKVRQRGRGFDSFRKREELEAKVTRYEERIAELKARSAGPA